MSRHPFIQTIRKLSIHTLRWGIEHSPWKNSILFRLPKHCNQIALTFDDGPDPEYTPRLLDLLAKHQLKATFFVLGKRAEEHPQLLQRMVNDGHTIGNHTYSHINCSKISLDEVRQELARTDAAIRAALPEYQPLWFRPPWGQLTRAQRKLVLIQGRRIVLWSYTVNDHSATTEEIIDRSGGLQSRDIFLLHDRNAQTQAALPELLKRVKEQGWQSLPLDQLAPCLPGNSAAR